MKARKLAENASRAPAIRDNLWHHDRDRTPYSYGGDWPKNANGSTV